MICKAGKECTAPEMCEEIGRCFHAPSFAPSEIAPSGDTPRTDAVLMCGHEDWDVATVPEVVPADFARQLERELAVMEKLYKEACEERYSTAAAVLAEREACAKACEEWHGVSTAEFNSAVRQCAEAIRARKEQANG